MNYLQSAISKLVDIVPVSYTHLIPPHLSEAYKYRGMKEGSLPITERYANEVLSLPLYNGMRNDELNYIISCINRF